MKPRGYAGDYLTIEHIYDGRAGGTSAFGELIDAAFLDQAAAQAVRNRRGILVSRIQRVLQRVPVPGARVMSLAPGDAARYK